MSFLFLPRSLQCLLLQHPCYSTTATILAATVLNDDSRTESTSTLNLKAELEQSLIDYGQQAQGELEYARGAALIIRDRLQDGEILQLDSQSLDETRQITDTLNYIDNKIHIVRIIQYIAEAPIRVEITLSDTEAMFNKDGEAIDLSINSYDAFRAASYISMLIMDIGLRLK